MNVQYRLFNISKICLCTRNYLKLNTKLIPSYVIYRTQMRNDLSTSSIYLRNDGILKTIVSKLPFVNVSKSRLKVTGYLLYESVADKIAYSQFFEQYFLPDTFYSWFVVTELHVWMLLARIMNEGEDGRFIRNCIVQAMWADVSIRAKKLGAANPSGVRTQIDILSQQFQAALVAYDEGLLSNDKVLANAIWRRVFQQDCDNPEHLESLVQYVRKQIKLLDSHSTEELLNKRQITWTSVN
ncbi:uncharacterized protein CBL_05012 [Carabus blaptoides fortunei]